MQFKKYSSIENHYRQKVVNYIIDGGFGQNEWVKLLKIHGANYSYFCNGIKSEKGKRTSFLTDETFYGDHHFDYTKNVADIYKYLKELVSDFSVVAVYGEVYGGVYNHPDVPKIQGYTKVQQEVQYCPENRFAAYDIEIDGVPLGWDTVIDLCSKFDIPLVPELERGEFETLLMSDTVFPDPLHEKFGLPPIEGNLAEGWILKPVNEQRFHNGERIILKGKNPNFNEQNPVKKRPKIIKLTDEGNAVKDILCSYITENRLRNVLSHIGAVNQKEFGKILGLFIQDSFDDFCKEHLKRFELLDLNEQALVKKFAGKEAGNVIRPHFTNIIDGEF